MTERVDSIFPVVSCSDLEAARDFYCRLLALETVFESGWYTLLRSPADPSVQLGFVEANHRSVPPVLAGRAGGVLVTVEVADVDQAHHRAIDMGAEIVQPLRDEPFGQRHFMAADPTGLVVDVITPIPMSREFLREVARWRRTNRRPGA